MEKKIIKKKKSWVLWNIPTQLEKLYTEDYNYKFVPKIRVMIVLMEFYLPNGQTEPYRQPFLNKKRKINLHFFLFFLFFVFYFFPLFHGCVPKKTKQIL